MLSFSYKGPLFDRRGLNFIKKWWINIDKVNFLIVLGIISFGLMMIASSSPAVAERLNVDKFFFLKKQIIFASIAVFLIVAISFLNQERIKLFAIAGLAGAVILLMLVLIVGTEVKGSRRWISLFGFTLQPSEFAKTFFVICNAYILQKFSEEKLLKKYGISAALFTSMICLLILQPDFGMSLTFGVLWLTQIFIYGLPIFLVYVAGFSVVAGGLSAYIFLPHVEDRINRFLNTDQTNYQVERSLDAFVNGSFFGVGTGNGMVKNFVPDAHTDFIFSVIGEEYGILSCIAIIIIFAYLITRIVKRLLDEENMFIYLALCGLMMQFTMQVIVNIGVSLRLMPTKGMTLPFISYGGSSMLSMAICFGLILALTKKKYHKDVDYGNIKMI